MGQPGDVDYRFTVDSSGVISAAAAIEGALGQAATGATAAGDKMNTALGKAATAGAKATTAIGPLSGVLGKVSPAAGAAAAGIAGLSGSVRALGAALSLSGPVMAAMTVALVAVAGAYTLIAKEAKRRGKWVHMGRVNSGRRKAIADLFECDTVDGTFMTFGPDKNLRRLLGWSETPSLFGGVA